jgi:hypothetical protein
MLDMQSIEAHLTPARARVPQIVYAAIAFSMMVLLAVLLFFYAMAGESTRAAPGDSVVGMLSIVTFVLWGAGVIVGIVFYNSYFRPDRIERFLSTPIRENGKLIDDPAEQAILLVQRAMIIRLVFFDIGAFIGIMTCLVGINDGALYASPIFLLNMVPAFFQIAFIGATFPTRERVLGVIREKVIRF